MKISVTGLNHRTAPVDVRERVAFSDTALPESISALRQHPGVEEALILSTCNRVEVLLSAEDAVDTFHHVENFLSRSHQLESASIGPHLYHLEGPEAIRHLFRVASSLDSMVVGEPQILGQLKSAYSVARHEGGVHGLLDGLISRALSVAKRVRTETEIGQSAASISLAAVELAKDIFGSLKSSRVLVIGAGDMAEQALRHLRRQGIADLMVTNRTLERAQILAEQFQGRAIPYEEMLDVLPQAEIVIASSGATHFILTKADLQRVMSARRGKPMFLIDIAVPRNIDPEAQRLDSVFLYDVDDLQRVVDANLKIRQSEADQAEIIIREEVERVDGWIKTRAVGPLIKSLNQQWEAVRQSEWQKVRPRLQNLSPDQLEAIELLTRGIVNKLAHGPMVALRRAAAGESDPATIELMRHLLRLDAVERDQE
jgi:glutamyl-tRNA reductase